MRNSGQTHTAHTFRHVFALDFMMRHAISFELHQQRRSSLPFAHSRSSYQSKPGAVSIAHPNLARRT